MQLIQTKVYSTRKAVHARYVLDCQNEEKTSEEIEALIYPSDDLYKTLGVERNNEFVQDEVYDSIKKIVSKVNKNFQAYSQISKITLLKEPLEMTTSQKVKRNFVAKIYELSHS